MLDVVVGFVVGAVSPVFSRHSDVKMDTSFISRYKQKILLHVISLVGRISDSEFSLNRDVSVSQAAKMTLAELHYVQ